MRIDLHTHSLCSDGSDTPRELVEKAAAAGLDVVALTDHDTTTGWGEARDAGQRLGVTVVLGVEFSTTNQGHGQHLLGYNIDPADPAIAEMLARGSTSRADRIEKLFTRLEELGIPVDRAFVTALAGGIPSRKHVAAGLVAAGHVRDEDEAFARYLNEGGPAYIERYRPAIEDAIAAIRAAGGMSVLAHPRDVKRSADVSDDRLRELQAVGLDGVEVDHQAHPPEVRRALRAVAADLGLVVTGSSDYHGTRKSNHELGCNTTTVEAAHRLLGPAFDGRPAG